MKKTLSLLLVLALALAIFALPAAAQTHDHDGCADCAAESVILRRPPVFNCPVCGLPCNIPTKNGYTCENGHGPYKA